MQEHMEAVTAYEAGWRLQPLKTVAIDLTAFRNEYEHLTSYARTPAALTFSSGVPFLLIRSVHDNLIAGESHGAEMMTTWTPSIRWSLSGATTWLDTNLHVTDPTVEAGNSLLVLHLSPHVQFTGRSSVQLTKRLDADAIVSYTGPWQKGGVSGYSRTDVRVGWRASRSLTADVGVQNLFERRHMETALFLYSTPTEIRRTGYARLIWKF
jgi:iron complex outermembrane recepter protein